VHPAIFAWVMGRILPGVLAALSIAAVAAFPCALGAQEWNDARTRALVERGAERRARQLADTGLADYRATARGYLTFLAQVGEGFPDPPKIVKADQLALEVYWRSPAFSKQRIIGRRDTLLLPTDINYHRDHLGIVQNNFPNIIRLGDGDEVRDVPHPLSAIGLATYDYRISDSLRIQLPDRSIEVFEVKLRPKNDRAPAAVGAVYLDRVDAQVVRMTFSFTRAALKDAQLEDVSIVLENALQENRFWLPRRQEIEIRRTGSWLDYPARGIIRGRWEICCYEVNRGIPAGYFTGPEIVQAPPAEMRKYPWGGRVLDSLPDDVRAVTDADVRRVQDEARALVRAQALQRTRSTGFAARSVSDFARVNRVEGLALGAGIGRRLGNGLSASVRGRYGFSDHEAKGEVRVSWQQASGVGIGLEVFDGFRDAGDLPEVSTIRNSIAAQEIGSDYTDPYGVRGVAATVDLGARLGLQWRVEGGYERQRALAVHATPSAGAFEPTIAAVPIDGARAQLMATRPTILGPFGAEYRGRAELRFGATAVPDSLVATPGEHSRGAYTRFFLSMDAERPASAGRAVIASTLGVVSNSATLPAQALVFAGGPVTGPGYAYHQFAARIVATQHVEWRRTIPFPALPLGRFGATGRSASVAPFAHVVYAAGAPPAPVRLGADPALNRGWYPSAGVGILMLYDLLRVDVARGLRDGRWTFGIDVSREFWGIL
jgi:hypothetical protein